MGCEKCGGDENQYCNHCEPKKKKSGMIINQILAEIENIGEGNMEGVIIAHTALLAVHIKALACHCECLGMNAENTHAICNNTRPPYDNLSYLSTMRKWELVDERGEVII